MRARLINSTEHAHEYHYRLSIQGASSCRIDILLSFLELSSSFVLHDLLLSIIDSA